jgi:hypothetical protein
MVPLILQFLNLLETVFKFKSRLEAENAALRLLRWHRAGFRHYWHWKSRNLGGRPKIDAGPRALIRRMSLENALWGAPRIQGELLKLCFAVAVLDGNSNSNKLVV